MSKYEQYKALEHWYKWQSIKVLPSYYLARTIYTTKKMFGRTPY